MNQFVEKQNLQNNSTRTSLLILALLQIFMLGALYTGTEPHPPSRVAPFALGPFISTSIAIAIAAYSMQAGKWARLISLIACATAAISFGPHKWFDAAIGDIWPAVLLAQIAMISLLYQLYISLRGN